MSMQHPGFFERAGPFGIRSLAQKLDAQIAGPDDRVLADIAPLSDARPDQLTFLSNPKYAPQLCASEAGACLIRRGAENQLPAGMAGLIVPDPYRAFAMALGIFYPSSRFTRVAPQVSGKAVDPSARIEEGVEIQPGAVIGPEAQIGRGTVVSANAVIGYRCTVGRDCFVGPNTSVTHALVGDRVIIHAGVRIGQDGFGFAMGPSGHFKVPQIGRVILQDDVEIGANTAIDRGALKDTVIGEGTKIDNLVQIGHNVQIGRHCVIVGQTGIAGSAELGDFVVMGGQSGLVGHIKVGSGAQIAGGSHAKNDVPAGARMAGTPAQPFRSWARELAVLKRLAGGKWSG